jgi:opacity protein-like surface antigen
VIVQIGSGTEILEEERYQDNWDKIGFEFGGGIKIALTPNLALRPEFRLLDITPVEGYNLGALK